jgi:hypothetical protein
MHGVERARDVYDLTEHRFARWRRFRNWSVALGIGAASVGTIDVVPPVRRFSLRDRRTGVEVGVIEEPWGEERDIAVLLTADLDALTPDAFVTRWLHDPVGEDPDAARSRPEAEPDAS